MWLIVEQRSESAQPELAVALPEGDFVVGRDGDCGLILRDRRVSRKHVTVRRQGAAVSFEDRGSTTGTTVNGVRAQEGALRPGDRLAVGGTTLRLEAQDPSQVERHVSLSAAGAASSADGFASAPPPRAPTVDWQPFQAFMDKLRRSQDPKGLLECLLTGLVDTFKAERGFVLLRQRPGAELVPVASHSLSDPQTFIAISRTVYERAQDTKNTIFIDDTMKDSWYLANCGQSLLNQSRAILCAPLGALGQVYGVIYVDAPKESILFSRAQLPLFDSVTGLASEILGAAQTRRNLLAAGARIDALNTLAWEQDRLVMGDGPTGAELQTVIQAASRQDVTVLVTGETGTGKEMVARALHRMSDRRDGPFVPVNCAALPRDTIEAELFGAEKGAYTGAVETRIGRFELAAGGTLFLDEVGELPLDFQVKLLRTLQERTITRLGGAKALPVDFRLVCATNSDLESAVRQGTVRQDFYYRINVFRVELKPLRQRRDDLTALTNYFLDYFAARFGGKRKALTPEAERLIVAHDWPGNVRELKNAIERALVVETTDAVRPESLPIARAGGCATDDKALREFWESLPHDYDAALEQFERAFLTRSLERHRGNVSAVAREYGKTRAAIYRRLTKLGLATSGEPEGE